MKRFACSAICAVAAGCAEDAGRAPGPELVAPRVIASSPRPDQIDVYPARLVGDTAPQVAIAIQFDEAMDPEVVALPWSAAGAALAPLVGTWSADRTAWSAVLRGMPLVGQRPLADATPYALDLRALRDASHNALDPDALLDGGFLRFTTATYDPLLNHACGHVVFGPYATVQATPTVTAILPRSDTAHTRYTVELPVVGGQHAGYTGLRPLADATWHLFLDGELSVALATEAGDPIAITIAPTPDACTGISHLATFHVTALDRLVMRFGPQQPPISQFIVEIVPDEGAIP